jgi:hypothetical protein
VTAKDHFNAAIDGGYPDRYVRLTYAYEAAGRKWSAICMSFSKCRAKPEEYSAVLGRAISQIATGDSIVAYVSQKNPLVAYLVIDSVDEALASKRLTWGFWASIFLLCFWFQWLAWRRFGRSQSVRARESIL